jgi:CheY-like chemotaxis protein
MAYM